MIILQQHRFLFLLCYHNNVLLEPVMRRCRYDNNRIRNHSFFLVIVPLLCVRILLLLIVIVMLY